MPIAKDMIKFENVSKRYENGHAALKAVSFHLDKGDMAFLTGHSGAGKSTVLKLITMIERTSQGRITVNDQNLASCRNRHIPKLRRKIGIIFQDHRLLVDRTVFDNVALPLIISGYDKRDISRRVRAALDKVGLLAKEQLYPLSLSTGEQQRVGIARAVVNKPDILLADEPTGNLDPSLSLEIMQLFTAFNQVGVTVLIATHDMSLIARMPYSIMTLDQGQLQ